MQNSETALKMQAVYKAHTYNPVSMVMDSGHEHL